MISGECHCYDPELDFLVAPLQMTEKDVNNREL